MQRWASYSTYDPIETLLEREDVTLVDVLDEDSLSIAMRNSSQKLVDFFKREEIMDELLNWALTELYVDHPKFMKFSRASISIFTCVTVNFQKMLHENDQFLIRLRQFQMLNPASPRICGHFQRIIETLVIGTGGDILVFFPELSDFLIENIANVGLRDLFVFLVTKYRIQFHADVEMFQKLINQIGFETNNDNIDNYNSCYCIISAIRAILSQKEEYFILFDTKEIFDRLFLLAVYPKTHPLLATGIYRLFPYLKRAKNYYPAMLKYRDMYEFRDDISLPYAIETFMLIDGKILLKIFDKNSCTYLIDAICKAFMNKGYYEKIDLMRETNLCNKIIQHIETNQMSKADGHIVDLALHIGTKMEQEVDSNFIIMLVDNIYYRIEKRFEQFGGEIEKSDSDDEKFYKQAGTFYGNETDEDTNSKSSKERDKISNSILIENCDDDEDESDDSSDEYGKSKVKTSNSAPNLPVIVPTSRKTSNNLSLSRKGESSFF